MEGNDETEIEKVKEGINSCSEYCHAFTGNQRICRHTKAEGDERLQEMAWSF